LAILAAVIQFAIEADQMLSYALALNKVIRPAMNELRHRHAEIAGRTS
jgi:hypothetical protein